MSDLRDIVTFSMGVCSGYVACRLKDEGRDPICLFSDTKREDEDTYRFGREIAERWGLNVVEASDGRDLWDVFKAEKMIPARQVSMCSRKMKIEPSQKWLKAFTEPARVAYGYDLGEEDRAERTAARWNYPNLLAWFPLIEWQISKQQCFGYFNRHGVKTPSIYGLYRHANCAPCKNFARQDWIRFATFYPEKFTEAMEFEEESGLHWAQEGYTLRSLLGEVPKKRRSVLAMANPAFDFSIGCDRCNLD